MLGPVFDEVETIPTGGNGYVSLWRNVIIDFPSVPSPETVRTLKQAAGDWFGRDERRQFGAVVVVPTVLKLPERSPEVDQFQKELAKLWTMMAPRVVGKAFIVLQKGFMGASVRAFLTATHILAGDSCPRKVFSAFDESAAWLDIQMQKASISFGRREELVAVLRELDRKRA